MKSNHLRPAVTLLLLEKSGETETGQQISVTWLCDLTVFKYKVKSQVFQRVLTSLRASQQFEKAERWEERRETEGDVETTRECYIVLTHRHLRRKHGIIATLLYYHRSRDSSSKERTVRNSCLRVGWPEEQPISRTKLWKSIKVTQQSSEVSQQSIKVTRQSIKVTRQPIKVTRQPIKVNRQSIKITRQSIKVTRQSGEVTRQSIKITRQSIKVTRQSSEVTRQSIKVTRQSSEVTRQSIKVTRQSIKSLDSQ